MADDQHPQAPLRPEHAFVVQFGPATRLEAGRAEGRVEHLMSRHATRFSSLEDLLAFVSRMLREVYETHSTLEP